MPGPGWIPHGICEEVFSMEIRSFAEKDAGEVSALIAGALRTSDIGDYSSEYIENEVRALQATAILQRVTWTHFHVACDEGKIVGCGESGPCSAGTSGKRDWQEHCPNAGTGQVLFTGRRIEIPASMWGECP